MEQLWGFELQSTGQLLELRLMEAVEEVNFSHLCMADRTIICL